MELYAIKINGYENPIGFLLEKPILSWKVRGASGSVQRSACVEVSDDGFSSVCWTLRGNEANNLATVLHVSLKPFTRYSVRLTVTDDSGDRATGECFFETALPGSAWDASWLGMKANETWHPEYQTSFSSRGKVRSARLYITGLGLFEAFLNGNKVGGDHLAPFINDYKEHVQYCTYDVTDSIRSENVLSVFLGNGWYRGRFGLIGKAHYERPFALTVLLRITYRDGSVQCVRTDKDWRVRRSVFTATDIYDGETQDWLGGSGEWERAEVVDAPAKLCERYSLPLCTMEQLPAKELIVTPAGETVLDFGQNFSGFVSCSQLLPAGTVMTMEFGEILQNGNFYHDNYRSARSTFRYISDGTPRQVYPRFTFFGFRYVKLSGLELVNPACFTGCAVYSKMDRTGFLETGNEKLNRLHENVLWGLKSNFLDMPTDCPQRDERLGYTGDAQVFCRTAGYLMDTRAFYAKYLRDLRSDQLRNDGKVALYLPNEFPVSAAAWSDAATLILSMLYEYYGERDMLERTYPLMKDYVDSIHREDVRRGKKNLWDFGFQFGDWVALDGATPQSKHGRTDASFIASAYYYASVRCVAAAAKQLGYAAAAEYVELAEEIRKAILSEYFTQTGRLAVDTQTGYLVALRFGLFRDKQRILSGLKDRLKQDMYRIKGGFIGATMMNTVLAENGMSDAAYDLLMYEGFPGWLYAVNLGATTVWERWNSVLPDGSMSGTEMNSLNHYAFGSVMEFVYRYAAGLAPLEPGFRRARIAPLPDVRLAHMYCCFESAMGRYVSNWTIHGDGSIEFHIEIPFGCEAEVVLPERDMILCKAGKYDFVVNTKRDYLALYDGDTPIERLLSNGQAAEVLERRLPSLVSGIKAGDADAASSSLNDMRLNASRLRLPIDSYDRAIEEVKAIRWAIG